MSSKQKTRRRPEIVQKRQKRDEHQICKTDGCHNVIAVWSNYSTCSLCRAGIR